MSQAVVAQKAPFAVDVEAGKTYFWCACGKSAKQPFCDGSHKGSDFAPVAYKAEKMRIPTKSARYSNSKPATYSDLKPAGVPTRSRPPGNALKVVG